MIVRSGCFVLTLAWLVAAASAADKKGEKADIAAATSDDAGTVAATVNGNPITTGELQEALAPTVSGRQIPPPALAQLQAEALSQMIDRRLVEKSISDDGNAVSDADVDAAIKLMETQLEGQKSDLKKYLADRNLTREALRKQVAWQLLWERTVHKQLTEDVLEDYFDEHRKEFDGTEVRASHILLRPEKNDPAAVNELLRVAAALREQLTAGKLSFGEAAAKFSAGPSREKGGDIGFFPRHGLMVEPFAKAAFALPVGELSQPVATPFGVHLIKVTEIKPGTKKLSDVRDDLKPLAAQMLFDKLAKLARDKAKIDYTGAWPHFKPGTREVVLPGK